MHMYLQASEGGQTITTIKPLQYVVEKSKNIIVSLLFYSHKNDTTCNVHNYACLHFETCDKKLFQIEH